MRASSAINATLAFLALAGAALADPPVSQESQSPVRIPGYFNPKTGEFRPADVPTGVITSTIKSAEVRIKIKYAFKRLPIATITCRITKRVGTGPNVASFVPEPWLGGPDMAFSFGSDDPTTGPRGDVHYAVRSDGKVLDKVQVSISCTGTHSDGTLSTGADDAPPQAIVPPAGGGTAIVNVSLQVTMS